MSRCASAFPEPDTFDAAHAARHYAALDRLPDGREVKIRSIRPEDKDRLQAGLRSLSPESAYFRFFQAKREFTDAELVFYTEPDFVHHVALVALIDVDGKSVPAAIARYVMDEHRDEPVAEVAFAVYDAFQGHGLGTMLLQHLTRLAQAGGIRTFKASVLPSNRKMLEVFAHSGLPETVRREDGVIEVELALPEAVPG